MYSQQKPLIDQEASFSCFVYPFLFQTKGKDFDKQVQLFETTKIKGRKDYKKVWKPTKFPEDDLLNHVVNYLNTSENSNAAAQLWQLNDPVHDDFGLKANWQLSLPKEQIPFKFDKIQLALFQVGVGFLTVFAQPKSDQVKDWLNFIHYFRFVRGQRGVKIEGKRRTGKTTETAFFPETAGGVSQHPDGIGKLDELLKALLKNETSQEESLLWWQEVFVPGQMLPFVALYVDGLSKEEIPLLRYKLSNFFNAKQGKSPAPEQLQSDTKTCLPYAKQQWFLFSLEGGSFLAVDAPRSYQDRQFFRETLPQHLRSQYYLLFLLALHQRFALLKFSNQVAQGWRVSSDSKDDVVQHNLKLFAEIRSQLLMFTAQGYFSQAMQRENHHRCYRKWQEIFLLERLYREVNDEVREMQEYARIQSDRQLQETIQAVNADEKERDRQLNQTIFIVSFGLGFAAIAASSSGLMTVQSPITVKSPSLTRPLHPFSLAILLSLGFGLVGIGIGWLVNWWLNRNGNKKS